MLRLPKANRLLRSENAQLIAEMNTLRSENRCAHAWCHIGQQSVRSSSWFLMQAFERQVLPEKL